MTPTDDQLRGYLLGTLSQAAADEVAAWVEQTPNAIALMQQLDAPDALAHAIRNSDSTPYTQADATADSTDTSKYATSLESNLSEDYRILRELGHGGMGAVFEAEDLRLHRHVAIKTMLPKHAERPDAKLRFLREARAMAAIEDEHIVPVLHVGESSDGMPYLVMPLLIGETLEDRLKRGPLNTTELIAITRDTVIGLAAAHAQGLIHRDIKPSNLWIETNPDGSFRRVRVLDFGLARITQLETNMTTSGTLVGTPRYMSPEQARGGILGPPSDLFSLGIVMYRAASGKMPFQGETASAVLTSLAVDTPQPVHKLDARLPQSLSSLIHDLLQKEPDARPKTDEVLRRLGEIRPIPPKSPRKSRIAFISGFLAALVLFIAGVVIVVRDKDGKVVGTLTKPEGGTVAEFDPITKENKPLVPGQAPQVPPKVEQPVVVPVLAPPPVIEPGKPFSPLARTQQPKEFPGIKSWTVETRRHRGRILSLALTKDGKLLAVGDVEGTIRIYETEKLKLVKAFVGSVTRVSSLAWTPKGDRLLARAGNSVQVWEYPSGQRTIGAFKVEGQDGYPMLLSADGTRFSVANTIYNISDGSSKVLKTIGVTEYMVWHPDDTKVAALEANSKQVEKIQLKSGDTEIIKNSEITVYGLAWAPDGKSLAISWDSGTIIYQGDKRRKIGSIATQYLAYSTDGRYLIDFSQAVYVDLSKNELKVERFGELCGDATMSTHAVTEKFYASLQNGNRLVVLGSDFKQLHELKPFEDFRSLADGHYRVDQKNEAEIVYVIETEKGQETLTPAEFTKRTGWKNDRETGFDK